MNPDDEHLRLLSIFHYVVAGLVALFGLFPVVHLVIGILAVTGRLEGQGHGGDPGRWFGWFFIGFALIFILAALTFAVLLACAGRFLARRQHYLFCLVVAALACGFMPFGTLLGVFTLLVLLRDSVKRQFGYPPGAPGDVPA